ncbi:MULTISPECIES: hypothetical protein [Niastella]|uniref:Lipoprotein n=1 Tax=Niastella soli TaxID=2821487 RepID=A0ABS3Z3B3_9BACT|nr:hypothetical protein [Niastella soli]MBO9204666.1 hypothetical protein [Niastella soli]
MFKSMSVFGFLFIVIWGSLLACNNQNRDSGVKKDNPTADTVVKDIPLDEKGLSPSWYRNKPDVEKKMGLATLENGFDSLQIRLWYGYAFHDTSQLVILTNTKGIWQGDFYNFQYHLNKKGDSIESISKQVVTAAPRSGWPAFINKLFALHIQTLPDYHKIPEYYQGMDGDILIVEIASKKQYRTYSYQAPSVHKDQFKEARNIEDILDLVENEFGFYQVRKF